MGVVCATTGGHAEVPVHATSEDHVWVCGPVAAESVSILVAHVTTKGSEDVPDLRCFLGPR